MDLHKKAPVIPGDILLVDTKRGTSFICVSRITYIAGQEFCSNYKKVRKHMKYTWKKRKIQIMGNSMDYIYTSGEQKVIIEAEQKIPDVLLLNSMCNAGKCRE